MGPWDALSGTIHAWQSPSGGSSRLIRSLYVIIFTLLLLIGLQTAPAGARDGESEEDVQTFRVHTTQKGDTLRSIAARKDVLRDPLKWILLYRLNRDALLPLKVRSVKLADAALPSGLDMIYISPEEAGKQALKINSGKFWVVSLYSEVKERNLATHAVQLADTGYNVYLSRHESKRKKWIRLRVGFYSNRKEADVAGRQITRFLGMKKYWVQKVPISEIREFGAYIN